MKIWLGCIIFIFAFSLSAIGAEPKKLSPQYQSLMSKIDSLTHDQKMQEALDYLNAETKNIVDPIELARAYVKTTQIEMALHGYETAVKDLKARTWPADARAQVLLNLFYARALQNYAHSYSWEIVKREKTNSNQIKDLKTWTTQEIFAEAYSSLNAAWKLRQSLNSINKSEFIDFVSANTYPDKIRESLRDSISYLFVQMLNDSTGWTPEQSNDYYQLGLIDLIRASFSSPIDLNSPKIHPIQKIAYIFEDLRVWNEQKLNIQGALESKLALLRILHSRFSDDQDREVLRYELKKLLDHSEANPWYSMGAATLAEFWQENSAPDSLVIARKIAVKGSEKFSKSLGAAKCRDQISTIDQPTLSLQGMRFDGQSKRSFGLQYKNLKKVYFRSYRFDQKDFALTSKDYNYLPSWKEFRELQNQKPKYEWSTELAETTDFKSHWHFVAPPKHENGFYIVVASMQASFAPSDNIITGIMATFGPFVLTSKNLPDGSALQVEAILGSSGDLLPGVKVDFYKRDYSKGAQFIKSETTDKNGRIEFSNNPLLGGSDGQYLLVAEHKGALNISEFYLGGRYREPKAQTRAIIYTDRSIYRPQQKIKWKAVYFRSDLKPGQFHLATQLDAQVTLFDMNNQEIQKSQVKTDEFGAAWGEFNIPTGRTLGSWRISTTNGTHSLRVEEYKRPTFELSWKEQKTAVRFNQPAEIIGEAKYYFGLPLSKGRVVYKVEKQAVFPWWCFWGYFDFSSFQKSQIVQSGSTDLDKDGNFKISFTPTADERLAKKIDGLKYTFTISADVTDEGGETRTSQKFLSISAAAIEAQLNLASKMAFENQPTKINLKRSLVVGGPAPGTGQWELYRLDEPDQISMPAEISPPSFLKNLSLKGLQLPGDIQQPRWSPIYNWSLVVRDWKQGAQVQKAIIKTDEQGDASFNLSALKAGAYRLRYSTKDQYAVNVETQVEFFVANSTYAPALPGLFLLDKAIAKVNEKVHLWLPTGLKNQTLIFEVYQDQKVIEKRYLKSGKDSLLIEWPIKEEHRGGLAFSVRLLNDYQSIQFSETLFVPWDNKEISIETKTFRDRLQPGQKEKWTFHLSGPQGAPIKKASAQLLAYMYDRSLDALAPHSSQSLLSIYPNRAQLSQPQYLLGQAPSAYFDHSMSYRRDYNPPQEDSLIFYSSYGIGGPGRRGGFGASGGQRLDKSSQDEGLMSNLAAAPSSMPPMGDSASSEIRLKEAGSLQVVKKESKRHTGDENEMDKLAKKKDAGSNTPEESANTMRSNFSENAFFYPNLTNSENGDVDISFEVPDSVTSWTLWLQTLTKDLKAGALSKQMQTVKDLMVRPYLPRFLREGDKAQIKIVVNNASDKAISGTLDIQLLDDKQVKDVSSQFKIAKNKLENISFSVAPKKSFTHVVPLDVPPKPGLVYFKVMAKSKGASDGELRPLPILPGRFHLMQSRFVTLNNKDKREMNFPDFLKKDDPSLISEKMVVQIDAQLFYSVLSALPYLVNYPYECIEQTLNRFLSTGIMTSIFSKFPAIEKMAKSMSKRKTKLESFDQPDANRKMALEETPWLVNAKGGAEKEDELSNILDSSIARESREDALRKMEKAQTGLGGFPWFPGGPPSPYMTLYIVYGFSKALEFGVDVPKPMIQKAWGYLHRHYIDEMVSVCMAHNACWETITFLNYVLSNYPDESWGQNVFTADERAKMLDFSFKHWRAHSPYLKGYLALTLHRAKRPADSKLVWDSVMDSAKFSQDEGTHWAREDRSWLWYNDTIETHAFALRTLMELGSDNTKRDGLVQWIFLNKKLNHWQSTRATSEVIYSLAHYLTKTQQMGKREAAKIKLGSEKVIDLEFLPDQYTGKKNQFVFEGEKLKPSLLPVIVEKETPGLMFASTTWHFSTEKLPAKAEGDFLSVERKFFLRKTVGKEVQLLPLAEGASVHIGDEVEVQISLKSKHPVDYVHLRDPRGAGFEPTSVNSQHKWDLGIYWYEEIRDSGTNFFFEHLPQGEYNFKYRIRATTAGDFKVSPATLQPMYATEFAAYSAGQKIRILE